MYKRQGLFGAEVSRRYWMLKVPPFEWLARLAVKRFAVLSGARLRRGPEDEPIGIALETLRWHRLFGRFGDAERDWWAGLREVAVPLLVVASDADRQCPPDACRGLFEQFASADRAFVNLGRGQGFAHDYDHVQMLVSKPAQDEVWPLVLRWLTGERQSPRLEADEQGGAAIAAVP